MYRLNSFRIILVLTVFIWTRPIFYSTSMDCDPCPEQTQTGEVNDNPNMQLKWEDGYPPSEIVRNKTSQLKLKSGMKPYTWKFIGLEETEIAFTSPEMSINITPNCSAKAVIRVSVSNGKNELTAMINVVDMPLEFDYEKTGSGMMIANSQKNVFVKGGCGGPYTWTVEENGFYFDSSRTTKTITTDLNQTAFYTDGSACGSATISVVDGVGEEATGHVLSESGLWGPKKNGCIIPGVGTDRGTYRDQKLGKYYQYQSYIKNMNGAFDVEWGLCPGDCDERCATDSRCDAEYGCDDCLFKDGNVIPCTNEGYAGVSCPPVSHCRRWCKCTTELWLQEWVCPN